MKTNDLEVDSVTADVIAADSIYSEHVTVGVELSAPIITAGTVTGATVQSDAAASTGTKLTTTGLRHWGPAGLDFSATSGGVLVKGRLEAGGLVIDDDTITFEDGSEIEYSASDGGLSIASPGGVFVSSPPTLQAGLNVNGGSVSVEDFTAIGAHVLAGSVSHTGTIGFCGATARGPYTLNPAGSNAARITALESLAIAFGLGRRDRARGDQVGPRSCARVRAATQGAPSRARVDPGNLAGRAVLRRFQSNQL